MWKYIIAGFAIVLAAEIVYIGTKLDEGSVYNIKRYFPSAGPPPPTEADLRKLQEAKMAILLEEAKVAVRSTLRDPTSAQFTEEGAIGDEVVCGNVNAKNGFGGYVGRAAFIYKRGEGVSIAKDQSEAYGIDSRCLKEKASILTATIEKACKETNPTGDDLATCKRWGYIK